MMVIKKGIKFLFAYTSFLGETITLQLASSSYKLELHAADPAC